MSDPVDVLAYRFWSVHPNELGEWEKTAPAMPAAYKGGMRAWFFACEIRKAILAERERCASIAEDHSPVFCDMEYEPVQSVCSKIADAIRGKIESGANAAANSPALESAAATRTATTEIQND